MKFLCDIVQARARYKQSEDSDTKQLERELSDLRFVIDQWPDDLKASRAGMNTAAGIPPTPARPCLSIDTLRDPIAHVAAEAQQTDLGPEIVAADDFSALVGPIDDTEIELREGLVRKIQRESDARDARNWAADRARKAGRGYYLVMTRYASQRSNDQDVYVDRIYNQSTVRLDPHHEKPDGSDCDWEFWGTDLSWDAYQAEYPERNSKKRYHGDDDAEWRGLGDEAPDWYHGEVSGDRDTRSVRVMNYMFTHREEIELTELADGRVVETYEVPPGAEIALDEDGETLTRRDVKKTVYWAKIDGANVLDEVEWPSPHMPIVKVVWEEVQPYDTERRVQGMVRPARDAAFGVSVMATTEVEVALQAPRMPVVGYAGQFEGFEEAWNQWNVRPIGRLEVNAKTDQVQDGTILPFPARLSFDGAVMQWDGLRNMFVQAVKSTTGVPDATLGNVDPSVRSGRAIRQLIEQSRQGTSGGLANLVKSVTYEAKIINSLLYPIYGRRKGRLMQIMTGKHETQGVLIGQPFVRDDKQRPVPFNPTAHAGQEAQTYALTEDATFNVAIRVSKDYDTRRQEEASTLGELIQANPALMTWFGDLFFENQDGPGHKDMAERAKLMLDPKILAQLNQKAGGTPPEVQAQLQALQAELQKAMQFIQTKQAEQQGMLQKAQFDNASKEKIEQLRAELEYQLKQLDLQKAQADNAAKIEVARIGSKKPDDIAQEAAEERLSTGLEQVHEVGLTAMEHAHERDMATRQAEQAQAQQGAQLSHEQQMAQQAAEQQTHAEPS